MTRYRVGDSPVQVTVLIPEDGWSLVPFESVTARALDPDGVEHGGLIASISAHDDDLRVTWPTTSIFDKPGLWQVLVDLTTAEGKVEHFPPYWIPVEEVTGWHTIDSIREVWRDAPTDDAELFVLLGSAKDQCAAFAPAVEGRLPLRYRQAQAMQARALWNAGHTSQDQFGAEGMTVTAFPMDWQVKNLLRPKQGVGAFW